MSFVKGNSIDSVERKGDPVESILQCLASNVRTLRKRKNWTQTDLAKAAGLSLIFVQGIEAERKWVSPATAHVLAQALGVSESKLFENCFEGKSSSAKKKINRDKLEFDHVPDDIFYALATLCREPAWKWEFFRWVLDGFERNRS